MLNKVKIWFSYSVFFSFLPFVLFPNVAKADYVEGVGFLPQQHMVAMQSDYMFQMIDEVGVQTLLGPASLGLNGGDYCSSGVCFGNIAFKFSASNDELKLRQYESSERLKSENLTATAAASMDLIYDSFDARYSVFAGYMQGKMKPSQKFIDRAGIDTENTVITPMLGGKAEFYNGNFFFGMALNGGYARLNIKDRNFSPSKTFSVDAITAGTALKLGYNLKFPFGIAIQPNARATASYFYMEDVTVQDDALTTVEEKYDDLYAFEVAPGLRAAKDLGNCWTLTGYGSYVWVREEQGNEEEIITTKSTNAVTKNEFTELHDYDNYLEYGVGVSKNWRSSSLTFNAKRREGDRRGWSADLTFEVRI